VPAAVRCENGDACDVYQEESCALSMDSDSGKAEHRRDVEALKSLAADLRGRVEEMQEERASSESPDVSFSSTIKSVSVGASQPDQEYLLRYVNQCLQASRMEMAREQAKAISAAEHWARTAAEFHAKCSLIAAKLEQGPAQALLSERFDQSFSNLRTEFQVAIEQEHDLINKGVQAAVEEFYKEVEQGMVERVLVAAKEVARNEVLTLLGKEQELPQETCLVVSPTAAAEALPKMQPTAESAIEARFLRPSSCSGSRTSRTPRPHRSLMAPKRSLLGARQGLPNGSAHHLSTASAARSSRFKHRARHLRGGS